MLFKKTCSKITKQLCNIGKIILSGNLCKRDYFALETILIPNLERSPSFCTFVLLSRYVE